MTKPITDFGKVLKKNSGYTHYMYKNIMPYKRRKCHWSKDSVLERVSNTNHYSRSILINTPNKKYMLNLVDAIRTICSKSRYTFN